MELKLLAQLITKLRNRVFIYERSVLEMNPLLLEEDEGIKLAGRIAGLKEGIAILVQPFLPKEGAEKKPPAPIKRSRRERDAMRDSDRRAGLRD